MDLFSVGSRLGLLFVLTLLRTFTPGCGQDCGGFRHLENGRTFFRYGGLYVTYRCNRGFKLHGYHSNSCVSEQWSREPPVCVASGCPNPDPILHGVFSVIEQGSWVIFSCNLGYHLHGPSLLYCKGRSWNHSNPICKEFDMMITWKQSPDHRPQTGSNTASRMTPGLLAPAALKDHLRNQHGIITNTAPKDAVLNSPLPGQNLSKSFQTKLQFNEGFGPKVYLKDLSGALYNKALGEERMRTQDLSSNQTELGSNLSRNNRDRGSSKKVWNGTNVLRSEIEYKENQTLSFSSQPPLSSPGSHSLSLPPSSSASPPSSSSLPSSSPPSSSLPPSSSSSVFPSSPPSSLPVSPSSAPSSSPVSASTASLSNLPSNTAIEQRVGRGKKLTTPEPSSSSSPISFLPTSPSVPTSSSNFTSSFVISSPSPHTPTYSNQGQTSIPTNETVPLSAVPPLAAPTSTEHHLPNLPSGPPRQVTPHRQPNCPYPPVPNHGTFYFRNVVHPRPGEYRHYVQYACYPGYTLAHGDMHSYCQQGATWSGVTPVCLAVTPCLMNNGGCSQLCSSHPLLQNQAQCHCRSGFTLLQDQRTCRDINECEESGRQCQQVCVNTLGSSRCSCSPGFHLAADGTSCIDVDECLLPVGMTSCVFGCANTPGSFLCQCPPGYIMNATQQQCQDLDECSDSPRGGPCTGQCHNSPGSYHCSCPHGHVLAGDGHACMARCPLGFRLHTLTAMLPNGTKDECVDIDECMQVIEERRGGCDWKCVNLPGSHHCICPRGYTLDTHTLHCRDVNECARNNGGCSHLCVNQRGGHRCACPSSHRLSPFSNKKCLPTNKQS